MKLLEYQVGIGEGKMRRGICRLTGPPAPPGPAHGTGCGTPQRWGVTRNGEADIA